MLFRRASSNPLFHRRGFCSTSSCIRDKHCKYGTDLANVKHSDFRACGGLRKFAAMEKSGNRHSSLILLLLRKLGLQDSRRIIHSLKVGLALTLASLLVLLNHPYHWIGQNAIWAVITVVVVFETSAGATLGKGLNRGLGTVLAGVLALGAAHLADLLHATGEPIFIGSMVFVSGSVCTFMRAIPKVKKKFDYGVVIFMLTFCMVLVTGFRAGDEVKRASDRLLTIMIGGLISLAVSSFIFPHWAGKDLHRLTANNFDKLGNALEECVTEYLSGEAQFITSRMVADDADLVYSACRETVKSRNTEEALVVFASWEPPHGRFKLGYPWKQYLTVGAMLRHCAYSVLALHGCLRSEIQAPSGLRIIFAKEMLTASRDAADLLHELAGCIRNMQKPKGSTKDLLRKISNSAEDIKRSITKHSYLLATPESWAALGDSVHEHISVTKTRLASENETVLNKYKVGNSNRIQPEAPNYQRRFTEPTKRIHDHSTEESSLVKTADNLQLDEHEKDGPRPRLINAPKLHTLLQDEVSQSGSGDRPTSSPESTTDSPCSVSVTDERSTRSRVEDIAGAASLISFASLLIETLARLDHVVEAVQRLSQSGRFRVFTGGPSRVHVEEHCIAVCDEERNRGYSRMDKELSKTSMLSHTWKSSRNLPTNVMQAAAE